MTGKAEIVVYGASGYTGQLICERLAERGIPFIAAGRSGKRLEEAMAAMPRSLGAKGEIAVVDHEVRALTKLFEGRRIVVNVTGPFGQIGRPVIEAALAAKCHYLDTTGEPDWIILLRDEFGKKFAEAKLVVCPALSWMWAAGEFAAELAMEGGGIDSLDIVYAPGSPATIASTYSFMRMIMMPQYRLMNRELVAWAPDTVILNSLPHTHEVLRSLPWGGGAEPLWYEHDERVRNCRVTVALHNSPGLDWMIEKTAEYQKLKAGKTPAELEELTNSWASTIAYTPPREDLDANRSVISCRARGRDKGREIVLYGSAPYEQTGVLAAEGARRILEGNLRATGFASPSRAFGHRELIAGLAKAGVHAPLD